MARLLTCSLLAIVALSACGPSADPPDSGPGTDAATCESPPRSDAGMRTRTSSAAPSGAVCADGSTLTYDCFARGFFESYCVRCHSSTLTGAARMGAPPDVNLDSREGITPTIAMRIDRVAAAGPTRINTFMPISGTAPSDDERDRLGEWIACGAP